MTIAYSGDSITFPDNSVQNTAPKVGMVNRIINGSMNIDQRNAGASVTQTGNGYFSLDRWYTFSAQSSKFSLQQNAGSVTPPAGFTNYLGATSLSAYSVLAGDYFNVLQKVEGFNTADLSWGTASAASVTVSFWVRSSLTGTFGGSIQNSAQTRSYPFSYTISTANTWEQKTVTIPGDTTGTWLTTNGTGLAVIFNLGAGSTFSGTANAWATANYTNPTGAVSVVGTSGATFYITGVQLEKGSTATSFDYRPYGTELALCQRYFETSLTVAPVDNMTVAQTGYFGVADSSSVIYSIFAVQKRAIPTVNIYAPAVTSPLGKVRNGNTGTVTATGGATITASGIVFASGGTSGSYYQFGLAASAEL